MSNLAHLAAAQYAHRPKDERYTSIAELAAVARTHREQSKRAIVPVTGLQAIVTDAGSLAIEGKATGMRASLTHWSFGQLAAAAAAPAAYLRTLPAELAARWLNNGLANASRDNHALLM